MMINRSIVFWMIMIFLMLSLILLLIGQTMAIIDYEFAVSIGLQESVEQIGEFGVQVNRGFGVGDTLIYIPLIVLSIIGLFLKKKWALLTTAAVMGISSYWATTVAFIFYFLNGVDSYNFIPGVEYWVVLSIYILFGILGLLYLIFRGNKLIS